MPKFSPKIEFGILSVLLIFNVLVMMYDITNPGVECDEVSNACGTIALLKKTTAHYSSVSIPFFGRLLPLMCVPYHASLESYLLIPAFLLFNISVFALRITPIMYGLFGLLLTYAFAKQFFSRSVSLITMLLLATNPLFIFLTKIGNWASSYQVFFAMAALYSFLRWYRGRGFVYYLSGTLLLGLGSGTRGWFLIVVVGVVVAAMVFYKEILARIKAGKCKSLGVFLCLGFVSFCAGNFLFIYANFINAQSRFITFKWIAGCLRHSEFGIDNLDYVRNLWLRFRTLWELLGQNPGKIIFLSSAPANKWYIYGFIFSTTWLVLSLFFKQEGWPPKKRVIFVLVFLTSAIFASPFTVSIFQAQHLFPLLPVIVILISVGLVAASRFFIRKAIKIFVRLAVTVFLIFLTAGNMKGITHWYALSKRTGGIGQWSDAIYSLADWIKTNRHSSVFAFNKGYERGVFFLLEGSENIGGLYFGDQAQYVNNVVSFCNYKDSKLYRLCEKDGPAEKGQFDILKKTAASLGKVLIKEKVFYQKDGTPAYCVYSVK